MSQDHHVIWDLKVQKPSYKRPAGQAYKPLEPREGEPRQPNKDYSELLGVFGPY